MDQGREKFRSWPSRKKCGGKKILGKCSLCPLLPFPSWNSPVSQHIILFFTLPAGLWWLGGGKAPALGLIQPEEIWDKMGNLPPPPQGAAEVHITLKSHFSHISLTRECPFFNTTETYAHSLIPFIHGDILGGDFFPGTFPNPP